MEDRLPKPALPHRKKNAVRVSEPEVDRWIDNADER